jgi:N-acetylglucosamine kinase-like BadF-type ATPase
MKLIADSGSTKTIWVALDNKSQKQFHTKGINPFYTTKDEINSILTELKEVKAEVTEIFFYGSGCATDDSKNFVKTNLENYFDNANAFVDSDMLGAARAAAMHNEAIVAILGTGMNTCLYDGEWLVENVPPLGYMLGDEGSGAFIGKTIVADFLRGIMPKHLEQKFEQKYRIDKAIVLENVYKKEFPNRYLASFTKFLSENIDEQYSFCLLRDAFNTFFERNVVLYDNVKEISFIGSIAYYFRPILEEVASNFDYTVKEVLETPIEGLIKYHL